MQRIGLVFSGGGGKGPYEIGVWRAIEALGLSKDVMAVSGTSVGALNAVLFAQGDLEKAEKAWLSMSPNDVLSLDLKQLLAHLARNGIKVSPSVLSIIASLAMYGIFSRDGLLRIIQEYLDESIVKQKGLPCYACATKLPSFKATYFSLQEHRQNTVEDILLASSAIPIVFPIQKVEGKEYLDGFLTDNTPIKPLVDEGCNIIIVVMLSRADLLPTDLYPDCKIIPIYPQDAPGAALNFRNTAEKMKNGFDDAMAILTPVFELMETNYQYSVELQKYKSQSLNYKTLMQGKINTDIGLAESKLRLLKEMKKW
ncbi:MULTISPECIES: patatin-like phospholipase family protein [unclassified Vibrio]|uniref:patatin-like phospholipase family protein n=1 Tax=unclassified Vibrio TaxID=2614977 RepID=UPI00355467D3